MPAIAVLPLYLAAAPTPATPVPTNPLPPPPSNHSVNPRLSCQCCCKAWTNPDCTADACSNWAATGSCDSNTAFMQGMCQEFCPGMTPCTNGGSTPAPGGAGPTASGYTHFRFTPVKLRGDGPKPVEMVQLAELVIGYKGQKVAWPTGTTAASLHKISDGEDGSHAIDGQDNTKWLGSECVAPRKTSCALTIDLPSAVQADSFAFETAMSKSADYPSPTGEELARDPVQWTFEGCSSPGAPSADCWTTLASQGSDYDTPIDRDGTSHGAWVPCDLQAPGCGGFAFGGGGAGGGGDAACGGGCVFLILFFVGGFTYFAAGFALNHYKFEKRGLERVPHLDFLKDLPALVKEGAVYSAHKVRERAGGYSQV